MPSYGPRYEVTGRIELTAPYPTLHVDGGGYWSLEDGRKVNRYGGSRVKIIGIRTGFNSMAIERVEAA